MPTPDSFEEFQNKLFDLVEHSVPTDGLRFKVYVPRAHLDVEISSDKDKIHTMTQEYTREFWMKDPMHPTRFDDTDVIVLSNSMLMSDVQWVLTDIYKEFYKPNGIFHNMDVFFRRNDRIFAVLTLIRALKENPFTEDEVNRLKVLQPFVQFTLNEFYVPPRIHDRTTLAKEFELTPRELDVVEIAMTGASNKILVNHLQISLPTLRTHLQNIYAKVGVHSSSELISKLLLILR